MRFTSQAVALPQEKRSKRVLLTGLFASLMAVTFLLQPSPAQASVDVLEISDEGLLKDASHEISWRSNEVLLYTPVTSSEKLLLEEKLEKFWDVHFLYLEEEHLDGLEPQRAGDFISEDALRNSDVLITAVKTDDGPTELYVSSNSAENKKFAEELLGKTTEDPVAAVLDNAQEISEYDMVEPGPVFAVIGIVIGGIVAVILAFVGVARLLDYRDATEKARKLKKERKKTSKDAQTVDYSSSLKHIAKHAVDKPVVQEARKLAAVGEQLKGRDLKLSKTTDGILKNFKLLQETFELHEIDTPKRRILEEEFSRLFSALVELGGPKYYQDFHLNPTHWDDPQGSIKEVFGTFVEAEAQVFEAIKQVKMGNILEFRVKLEAINSFRSTKLDELYRT